MPTGRIVVGSGTDDDEVVKPCAVLLFVPVLTIAETIVKAVALVLMDLPPKLRQLVKTHFSSNGELSHGFVT